MREKLIDMLTYLLECELDGDCSGLAGHWADHLIENGVTIPVRCENCKHWFKGNSDHTYGWCCQRSDLAHVSYKDRTEPEDFCSKGERRNEE